MIDKQTTRYVEYWIKLRKCRIGRYPSRGINFLISKFSITILLKKKEVKKGNLYD